MRPELLRRNFYMPRLPSYGIPAGVKRSRARASLSSSCARNTSTTPSPPPPPPPSFAQNPLQWYIGMLDTHPITTKVLTSGIISGAGDLLCQYLSKSDTTINDYITTNDNKTNGTFDWMRSLRFTALGSFLVAPTVHLWYGMLMTRIPGTSVSTVAKRLFFDQGCFAPIFTATFISCLTVLEHASLSGNGNDPAHDHAGNTQIAHHGSLSQHIKTRLINDGPDAILVGWSMWVPSMAFMFAFVPGKFQVLFSNGVGFVWNAYLSWRTHEGEKVD